MTAKDSEERERTNNASFKPKKNGKCPVLREILALVVEVLFSTLDLTMQKDS